MKSIVVVGASAAGVAAVRGLRSAGFDGSITLLGDESHAYRRPPLSKQYVVGTNDEDDVVLEVAPEFAVERMFNTAAVGLRLSDQSVELTGGRVVPFDGLIIATGARARQMPGAGGLAGVCTLRTLQDAREIRERFKASPRVVVVGGGFIGAEIASSARSVGLSVHLVEAADVPFANLLGQEVGQALTATQSDHGVHLHLGVSVVRFLGDTHVEGVELSDGSVLDADLVIAGIGAEPATGWLSRSGVPVKNGVVCDASGAVGGTENVVAAGDVASWHHELFGLSLRVEHWDNAVAQGGAAARRLLAGPGSAEPFRKVPYFWSDQYDNKLQFVGISNPRDEIRLVEGAIGERAYVVAYLREERIVGALAMNSGTRLATYRKLIEERADVERLQAATR